MAFAIILVVIAAIFALFALIFAIVYPILKGRKNTAYLLQKTEESRMRQQTATWATALVVNSKGGFSSDGGEKALISLTLEVTPPDGVTYRASTTWLVDATALGSVQVGQGIPVKIDAENPKIIYPQATWAKYIVTDKH